MLPPKWKRTGRDRLHRIGPHLDIAANTEIKPDRERLRGYGGFGFESGLSRQPEVNVGGRLVWTIERPTPTRSGLALALSSDLRAQPASASCEDDGYRRMLTLPTRHPLAGW